jgi:hypothetical protein
MRHPLMVPENLAVLMGLPRSGTTIISRVIGAHSKIRSVIEPYQSNRSNGYSTVDFDDFVRDHGGIDKNQSLLVKETTTRPHNVDCSLQLLANAVTRRIRPLAIVILRSPIEAYLSQVEASNELWDQTSKADHSGRRFLISFINGSLVGLYRFIRGAARYHRRVVMYNQFIRNPQGETRRLMAAFPYLFETSQLDLQKPQSAPGDPTALRATQISHQNSSKRKAGVEAFAANFKEVGAADALLRLHGVYTEWAQQVTIDDDLAWDETERLLRLEFSRLGVSIKRLK